MQSTGTIEINAAIEDVFRLTTEYVPEWSQVVIYDEVINQTADGVGTTFRTVTEERGSQMEFTGVVTSNDPPYFHAVHLTGTMFNIDVEYRFESGSDYMTRVTQTSHVHGKGFFKIILFFCGWMMRKSSRDATQKELESLKQYCEEN